MKSKNSKNKLEIPGPEKIGGIHENISNPGGKKPSLTPEVKVDSSKLVTGKVLSFNDVINEIKSDKSKFNIEFIQSKYPLAYQEFLCELNFTGNLFRGTIINPYASIADLFNFFDRRGIMVEIEVDYTRVGYGSPLFCFQVGIFEEGKHNTQWSSLYRSRDEASIEGFEEAFKLLNEELHTISLEPVYRLYPGCTIHGISQFYNEKWLTELLFYKIDLIKEQKRFSPLMQAVLCNRQGIEKIQFHITHENQDSYPDYKIKELLK